MSDTNAPQVPDYRPSEEQASPTATAFPQVSTPTAEAFSTTPIAPAAPAAPANAVAAQAPAVAQKKLPAFLKVSIILLIGLTVASISLLFIGDFEGRFERVFSTFALFATFVVLTAIDTGRERKNDWYGPVALIANTYILGLLLIVIWITPYSQFSLLFDIIWKSLFVIVAIRLVIICCELLLRSGEKSGGVAVRFAFITSILAMLSGILFTAPTGVAAFNLDIPDLYWKISTALLILTALGLSVTLLLRWAGKSEDREEKRNAMRAAQTAAPQPYVSGQPYNAGHPYNAGQPFAANQQFAAGYPVGQQQAASNNSFTQQGPAVAGYPAVQQRVEPVQAVSQQAGQQPAPAASVPTASVPTATESAESASAESAPADGELLPWPTFADGQPIPAGPDGQPDFTVPGAPLPPKS